jgi:hypothetical protein
VTKIIFICPSCDELIYHEMDVDLDPPKFRSDEVPVTLAYMVHLNEVRCDRCSQVFVAECVRVPQTTQVLLTIPQRVKPQDDYSNEDDDE